MELALTLQIAFRIAIVWAGGFILAAAVAAILPDQVGLRLANGRGPAFSAFQPSRLLDLPAGGAHRDGPGGHPRHDCRPGHPVGRYAHKTERAARQQGSSFLRENSSNGGKTIRTFWLHSRGGGRECQGEILVEINCLYSIDLQNKFWAGTRSIFAVSSPFNSLLNTVFQGCFLGFMPIFPQVSNRRLTLRMRLPHSAFLIPVNPAD